MKFQVKCVMDLIFACQQTIDWWYSVDHAQSFNKSAYFDAIQSLIENAIYST